MDRHEVAQVLREIGFLIEVLDDNPKKSISYYRAARTIDSMKDFKAVVQNKSLEEFPGIGQGISRMIYTLLKNGYLPYYNHLRNKVPETLFTLQSVPGLGANKIRILYENFNVTNITELQSALKREEIHKLKGFGPAFVKKLQKHIALLIEQGASLLYLQALSIAEAIIEIIQQVAIYAEVSGSLRRKAEIIHEIDVVAMTHNAKTCMDIIQHHGLIAGVLFREEKTLSVLLKQGIKLNLHLASKEQWPFALLATTGSCDHLLGLKQYAEREGYLLDRDILRHSNGNSSISIVDIREEYDVYQILNLSYIPPEVREGQGEIDAAESGYDFNLIEEKDLCGSFHCHTIDSDGINTVEEMALAAKALGWQYLGISDHSKSSYQANGMDEERLCAQIETIEKLNKTFDHTFQIFSGLECDIMKDGTLDFGDDILSKLDFVIVSIHRYFSMPKEEMTKRLIKAIENPYTTIVGHMTGRLLRSRDPYQLDVDKVIDACIANHKVVELNGDPHRLDMDWRYWIKAREKGLKCCITTDAHSTKGLKNYIYGINMARKGWLQKKDVINTMSLKNMKAYLSQRST